MFPNHRHVLSFDERDHIIRRMMWWTRPNPKPSTRSCSSYAKAFLMSSIISLDHEIVQLPDTVGMLWVYQTSQRNWVIIKEYYRCLQRYMLGWRISRLGFVTPIVGEVSLGPLGNAHHISLGSIATNELVAGWCVTERVKRLAGNEIELGIEIPTIESRASNIPMTKGTTYVVMRFDR